MALCGGTALKITTTTLGHGWSWTSIDFELAATSDVKFGYYVDASDGKWASCDDWHLVLAGESTPVSVAGFATNVSAYNQDFVLN